MKIIVATRGRFLETLKQYAGTDTAVFPYGTDWTPVIKSADPFAALLQCPLERPPIDPLG